MNEIRLLHENKFDLYARSIKNYSTNISFFPIIYLMFNFW